MDNLLTAQDARTEANSAYTHTCCYIMLLFSCNAFATFNKNYLLHMHVLHLYDNQKHSIYTIQVL